MNKNERKPKTGQVHGPCLRIENVDHKVEGDSNHNSSPTNSPQEHGKKTDE